MHLFETPAAQLVGALVAATLVFVYVIRRAVMHFVHPPAGADPASAGLRIQLCRATLPPLSMLAWYYGLYAIAHVARASGWLPDRWDWTETALNQAAVLGLAVGLLWLLYRLSTVLDEHWEAGALHAVTAANRIFFPMIGTALRLVGPVVVAFLLIHLWPLSPIGEDLVEKLLAIALIAAVTATFRKAIILGESALIRDVGTDSAARALATRVSVLRKIALVLLTLFAVAAVFMLFPRVRHVGQSILASAGIAGIVLGFAAQKTLGNLLAGIQIALTQPVRIGDLVLAENELGNIEEITLTYVVIRTWDYRRLVLPIGYLVEKPIQNWTRSSQNLLSPVKLRVDYALPVAEFRAYLKTAIARSANWDGKVFAVQVTDLDSASMEIRLLGSAAGPGESFELQCELREMAVDYLCRHYPQCLPNFRPDRLVPAAPAAGGSAGHPARS